VQGEMNIRHLATSLNTLVDINPSDWRLPCKGSWTGWDLQPQPADIQTNEDGASRLNAVIGVAPLLPLLLARNLYLKREDLKSNIKIC
jgi:hypothetical protein